MGYDTTFSGNFSINPPLAPEHRTYLEKFSETRRMQRNTVLVAEMPDPYRTAVGLPVGIEGEFFVNGQGFMGQDNDQSVKDPNRPPVTQPSLWCHWVPSEDGTLIEWDGGEKFHDYIEWMEYLLHNFLIPWHYNVNGRVEWEGEDEDDMGVIRIKNNVLQWATLK